MLPVELSSLAAALGIGLLTGLERERRKLRQPLPQPAGLRTFTVTALLGWGAFELGGVLLLAVVALGVSALLAIAYFRSAAQDLGLTTEVALLLVLLLGAWSRREPVPAVAVGVVLTALLAWREGLHRFVRARLSEAELRDGLILAIAALVILPLVPDGFIGPYDAINLRTVWLLVVLMMGIGAVGHLAIRLAGPRFGLPLAGFIAGFASSTATIAAMGARSRREPARLAATVAAAVLSAATTMLLMGMVLAAIAPTVLALLWLPLTLAFLAACAYAARFSFAVSTAADPAALANTPLVDWRLALGAALMIAVVQLLSAVLFHWLGNPGLLLSTALSGMADVHAAAASAAVLVPAGKLAPETVLLPVLAALSSNTASRCVMALVTGGPRFAARVAPGLLLALAVLWLAWWLA